MPNDKKLLEYKRNRYLPGPGIINRYWLKGTLKTQSPLHVGTGEIGPSWKPRKDAHDKQGENCNYVVLEGAPIGGGTDTRDREGRPLCKPAIPGTSLRGVLRAFIESVLCPFNTPGRFDIASLSSTEYDIEQGLSQEAMEDQKRSIRDRDDYKALKSRDEQQRYLRDAMAQYLRENSDLVGFLFGSTRLRSRIAISHATCTAQVTSREDLKKLFEIRTGVSIDRDTGAAADSKLFDVEAVKAGVPFAVELRCVNVRHWELGLLLAALDMFNHRYFPIQLGGLSQHGLGRMSWSLNEVYQLGADEPSPPSLADWIQSLKSPAQGPAGAQASKPADYSLEAHRKTSGPKDPASFIAHCVKCFDEVMTHVCA